MIQLLASLWRFLVGLFWRSPPPVAPSRPVVVAVDRGVQERARARAGATKAKLEAINGETDAEALARLAERNAAAEALIKKGQGRR